ncbi:signal transduction histidine kinase [Brachybacterium squillarum]|uniref:signal transduction histidine kinase n=1 Tax=Brachybacterium squillarum TaxID=661979 RepID=UPI000262976A|nr:signal transduction histidine kinase [Brachybacterium squillarum]
MAPDRTSRDARRAARGGWTVRTRVLSTMLAFMAAGLAVTGVLTYAAQFRALEDRVEAELGQELRELERIAQAAERRPAEP